MVNALFNDNRLKLGVFGLNVSNGCAATTAEGYLEPNGWGVDPRSAGSKPAGNQL
jgi:hypothetical protein